MIPSARATIMLFQTPGGRLEMAARPPPDALRPWVRQCCGYVETATGPVLRTELPKPAAIVIIVDIIHPDFDYVLQNRDQLSAVFLTHGHEDHIGFYR